MTSETMTDRTREPCPICGAPCADGLDDAEWVAAGGTDDFRRDLCWTWKVGVSGDHEGRDPIDWRARAQALEQELRSLRSTPVAGRPELQPGWVEEICDDGGFFSGFIDGRLTFFDYEVSSVTRRVALGRLWAKYIPDGWVSYANELEAKLRGKS